MVGLGRVELPTSPLSGVRSSQLSYRPIPDTLSSPSYYESEGSYLRPCGSSPSKLNSSTIQSSDCLAIQADNPILESMRLDLGFSRSVLSKKSLERRGSS